MCCRSFSQHWIIVGKQLRVLLLDFDGKFNLLIPNIDLGKAFRSGTATARHFLLGEINWVRKVASFACVAVYLHG